MDGQASAHSDVQLRCVCVALCTGKAGHSSEQAGLTWKPAQLGAGAGPPEVPHIPNYAVVQCQFGI